MTEQHHKLKCWPGPFGAILNGHKRFELRENDRGFRVNDVLFLREWSPGSPEQPTPGYTGATIRARVTSMVSSDDVGLPWAAGLTDGWCVMGISIEGAFDPASHAVQP